VQADEVQAGHRQGAGRVQADEVQAGHRQGTGRVQADEVQAGHRQMRCRQGAGSTVVLRLTHRLQKRGAVQLQGSGEQLFTLHERSLRASFLTVGSFAFSGKRQYLLKKCRTVQVTRETLNKRAKEATSTFCCFGSNNMFVLLQKVFTYFCQ